MKIEELLVEVAVAQQSDMQQHSLGRSYTDWPARIQFVIAVAEHTDNRQRRPLHPIGG